MNNDYQKWLAGDCCCANNFIHIETPDCKRQDVCDCERILLEISNLHTDDLVLQEEIDELSGIVDTKLDASAYTPTDLSDYYTKEEVDALIPSGGSITVDSELSLISTNPVENRVITEALNDKLDASAYTPTEQVQSDWNVTDSASTAYIKNKPIIPVVPTDVSAFNNDVGYLTEHQSLADYVTNSTLIQYITNLQQQIDSLTSAISGCCGSSGETQYRWIIETGENDYWCSGTTKMSMEKQQSSTDGINWTDTGSERSGSTVLEENCVDCGYLGGSRMQGDYSASTSPTTIASVCSSNIESVSIANHPHPTTYNNCITSVESALTWDNTVTTDRTSTTIENGEYANTDLLGAALSSEITAIGEYAFSGNTSLSAVSVGAYSRLNPHTQAPVSNLTSIGNYAFKGCTNLLRIELVNSNQVPTLGTGAFDGCTSLNKIYVKIELENNFKTAWPQYASIIQGI